MEIDAFTLIFVLNIGWCMPLPRASKISKSFKYLQVVSYYLKKRFHNGWQESIDESWCVMIAECSNDVKVAGYAFTPLKESVSYDIADLASEPLLTIAAACNADEACVGFNSNGLTKSALRPIADWVQWTDNPCQGLYTKDPGKLTLV